ncbi:MAG: SURF1 family protein [Hyphomicrobiales bacterium]|nr:SURF1 family protein [Hyphomicrobiales bacterium]
MRRSTIIIILTMTSVMAVLAALGSWQVNRLRWKEDLIARINARMNSDPRSLEQIELLWQRQHDVNYFPTSLQGNYDHQREMYYFNTLNGQSGWNIITPLILQDNRIVLLNRGFVPFRLKNRENRRSGQIEGQVEVIGLARNPVMGKPNSLIPDNSLQKREFFWKSHDQMATIASANTDRQVLPFMIDQGETEIEGGYPIGGTTRVQFSNSHLQYAVTWYGLALALFAVGSAFLYSRRNQPA